MWKVVNALHPNSKSGKFPPTYNEEINNHQKKLLIPYSHRAIKQNITGYSLYSFKLWNQQVPIDIKYEKMIEAFNRAYKNHH